MAPDLGAEIDGGEDSRGVYPDVVENVGSEWGDEVKGVGLEVGDAGDISEEVSVNELLLWDPEFVAAVVDDCVLMGVAVNGEGASGGGKEVRKNFR